ncbi:MAG: hypothetical protein JW867_06565, partial [Candidatus Omnitrophica bacterium]|nr:hypothetical protein [Candidatus Omnitrophota bacterium]
MKNNKKNLQKQIPKLALPVILGLLVILIVLFAYLLSSTKKELTSLQNENAMNKAEVLNLQKDLSECNEKIIAYKGIYGRKIKIVKNNQDGYILYVDDEPFMVKGMGYNPTPIGKGYNYDLFKDENKPWLIDGLLMKEAGINCVRIYSASDDLVLVAQFIRDMYDNYGIYTIMSDWLGLWDYPRANYADKEFQKKTKDRILKMVSALKNEKGLLMWILGNENNYTFSGQIGFWTSPEIELIEDPAKKKEKKAEIYYAFVNDLAKEIKKIDNVHPVALGNGEEQYLNIARSKCPDIDLLAIIFYRGKKFYDLFDKIRRSFDKPILVSEFGSDSYDSYNNTEVQNIQADFIISQWEDIYKNTVLSGNQSGNVFGGCLFEWTDEWWKHNEGYTEDWSVHNTEAGWSQSAYYFDNKVKGEKNMNEEWFGVVALDERVENGINQRLPKKSYYS